MISRCARRAQSRRSAGSPAFSRRSRATAAASPLRRSRAGATKRTRHPASASSAARDPRAAQRTRRALAPGHLAHRGPQPRPRAPEDRWVRIVSTLAAARRSEVIGSIVSPAPHRSSKRCTGKRIRSEKAEKSRAAAFTVHSSRPAATVAMRSGLRAARGASASLTTSIPSERLATRGQLASRGSRRNGIDRPNLRRAKAGWAGLSK
jgi:hypothetical protein